MSYAGLALFMEKLKQVVYSNDNPPINNHPSMLSKRPQFLLLYEELQSMIQLLFIEGNKLHDVAQVRNLMKRFKDVGEEAHDIVDRFVSVIEFKNKKLPRISNVIEISLNLEDVLGSLKSIKEEFISILGKVKMDSSPRTNCPKTQPAASGTSCTRFSKNASDEIVVGLDCDAKLILDKLVEDKKQLDVVSIVGMGGVGKTTLARKVFSDPYVVHHFHVRAWVTVSQIYEKWDLIIQILSSIGVELDREKSTNFEIRRTLHRHIMGKRCLIVIDDIWNTEAWDDLEASFPRNHTESRILLTSRLIEVALHAKSHGFVHHLPHLTDAESWKLLRMKVFHGSDCPESLIELGMKIAKGCHGLPLALVVIAGVLEKETVSKDSWERIAQNVTSYVVGDPNGYTETLVLSINHLPCHLRDCFLYLGGFPEDYNFRVRELIWLWVAEGFIQEARNQSLEETAEGYLMELVDRNLVVVQSRKTNGDIKTFSVHDVLRELCLEIATKERLLLKIQGFDPLTVAPYRTRRIFTDSFIGITNNLTIRSLLSLNNYPYASYIINKCSYSWMLLMVLDIRQSDLVFFPEEISLLVHLRYLAIHYNGDFQSSICTLWRLQTLIIECNKLKLLVLPKTISNLVNLRHLWCRGNILFPPIQKPMNLQTIFNVAWPKSCVKYFPGVKKLSSFMYPDTEYDFKSLAFLETLKVRRTSLAGNMHWIAISRFQMKFIEFPMLLKGLTLEGCHLPWSHMSKVRSLHKLEVLKLFDNAFVGRWWDAGEEPFQQLKCLKLQGLNVKQWKASSINFPCLKQLVLENCKYLKEIPLEVGYIPTLEHIKVTNCERSVIESVVKILEEQHADGNLDLKINVNGKPGNYNWICSVIPNIQNLLSYSLETKESPIGFYDMASSVQIIC